MNDQACKPLVSLIHRTRNALWCQRLNQSLWYGVCFTAITLLLAGAVHIALSRVSTLAWMALAMAPPLLAVLHVLFWQRPSSQYAAGVLDRRGSYNNLLVTAWEVLAIPRSQRSAGAEVVLRQAMDLSPEISIPVARAASSSWQGRYSVAPWGLMAIAIFLLQLPTQHSEGVTQSRTAAGYVAGGSGQRLQSLVAGGRQLDDHADAASASRVQSVRPEPTVQSPGSNPPASATTPGENIVAVDAIATRPEEQNPLADIPMPVAGKSATEQPRVSDKAALKREKGKPVSDGSGEQKGLQFESFARYTSGAAQQTIAGSGSVEFATPDAASLDTGSASGRGIHIEPGSVPYTNRFSLPQRLQIRSYYNHLEELP